MPPKKPRIPREKSLKNDVEKQKCKEDTVLNRQAFWSKSGTLPLNGFWLASCFVSLALLSSQRGTISWADSRTLWAVLIKKERKDLIREYFRRALLKQRPFYLPLPNLAQSPPKGNRAPTVRSVYFLLSWKAKVLLPFRGVTSIHQRKKWPRKAVKLV